MTFLEKLAAATQKNNSLLCVGLDPDMERLGSAFRISPNGYFEFCKAIVDATHDLVNSFKPNSAFFEAMGANGIQQLGQLCDYIRDTYPEIPIILDFKRGDIGNTNNHYIDFAFEELKVDAVTIQPYQGQTALQPFLDQAGKGIIVLCKMSNEGSGEFQDLLVDGKKLYLHVAEQVKNEWNGNGNCLLVAGATYPEELAEIRQTVGDDMWLLVPGFGAQGGSGEMIKAGLNNAGLGLIINSSRAVLYASTGDDFAEAARNEAQRSRDEINSYRKA